MRTRSRRPSLNTDDAIRSVSLGETDNVETAVGDDEQWGFVAEKKVKLLDVRNCRTCFVEVGLLVQRVLTYPTTALRLLARIALLEYRVPRTPVSLECFVLVDGEIAEYGEEIPRRCIAG